MDRETWELSLIQLKYSLQALALPAATQLRLLPEFVCKADELGLDYGHWCKCILGNDEGKLTTRQRTCLAVLNELLSGMSGQMNSHLWSDHALRDRPEWQSVRGLAYKALTAFGWELEMPPDQGDP